MLLGFHHIADGRRGLDENIHILAAAQEFHGIVCGVAKILMQGKIVHIVVGMLQNRQFPIAKGGHLEIGAAAGHQLNSGVRPFHHLGSFRRDAAVFLRGFSADLPGTVHLVAQAPHPDVKGFRESVFPAQVGIVGIQSSVAVFQAVSGLLRPPGAQIHRHHHL